MSGPATLTKGEAIVWADELHGAEVVRELWRDEGYVARILDAREWRPEHGVRMATVLMIFCGAANAAAIEEAYRNAGWDGEIVTVDLQGRPTDRPQGHGVSPAAEAEAPRQDLAPAPAGESPVTASDVEGADADHDHG